MTANETLTEHLNTYLEKKGATTSISGAMLSADFQGDLSTLTERMHEALEEAIEKPTPFTVRYYQEIIDSVDVFGYRSGDDLPWQHAAPPHGNPVLVTHYPRELRPYAEPDERNRHITNSAELVLPSAGPSMSGYIREGRAHLTIDIDRLGSYIAK